MTPRSNPRSHRWLALLQLGFPASLRGAGETARRATVIAGTAWLAIGACSLTLPVLALTTSGPALLGSLAATTATLLLALASLRLLRHTSVQLAAHTVVAIVFAGITFTLVTNAGLASPYWILLPAVPLLATQTGGRSAGNAWTLVCVALIAALLGLERAGVALPRFIPPAAHAMTTAFFGAMSVGAVHLLSRLADIAKDEAIGRAEQTALALERADLEVERAHVLAEQAVAASAAKSTFMATMSHELRTPLNAVIGYAEMLTEDAAEQGLTSMHDDLIKISGASRHLLGLIDDILDLSRVEMAKLEFKAEPFAIQDLVREVLAALEPLARRRKDVLVDNCKPDPIVLHLDRARVRQVLINLVGNAIKFTYGGSVTVRVRREQTANASWLALEVQDTGIGIADADQMRIFDSFVQVDSSPRRRYEGTGLGLSLCKRLAELMGGSITVQSRPGLGSTFTVRLPAAASASSAPAPTAEAC